MAHLREDDPSGDRAKREDKHVELSERKGYVEGPEATVDPQDVPVMGLEPPDEDD